MKPNSWRFIYVQEIFKFSKRILKELGSGCFGRVFKAELNGSIIATKIIKLTHRNEREVRNEINQLSRLSHQNIVRFIDYDLKRTGRAYYCYINMELMEGI